MRQLIFGLLLAVCLPGVAAARQPEDWAHSAPPRTPHQAWLDCMAVEAGRIDDGISDASTIGRGVFSACREEYTATLEEQVGKDLKRLADFDKAVGTLGPDTAVWVVLQTRATKRAAEPARDDPP
jgi:hypothetical protein